MKKLIASVGVTALLAGGLAVLAAAAPASAHTPTAAATCTVLTVDAASYETKPAVGEAQVEVENADYVPAVAEVSHTDYEYQTFNVFQWQWDYRWAHKDDGASVLYDWKIWSATGETQKHVDVDGKAAVGTPTKLIDNVDYVAADATPNTVVVTIDGIAGESIAFGTSYSSTFPFADASVRHTWSVKITSWNGSGSKTFTGITTACITPTAPVWTDDCGPDDNGTFASLPEAVGYSYKVTDHSALNGKVGVVATASAGYVFTEGARKQWTKTQDNSRCDRAVPTIVFTPAVCTAPEGEGKGVTTPASLTVTNPDGVKLTVKRKSDGAAFADTSALEPGHYDVIATVKDEASQAFNSVPEGWKAFTTEDGHTFKVSRGFDVTAVEPCDNVAVPADPTEPAVDPSAPATDLPTDEPTDETDAPTEPAGVPLANTGGGTGSAATEASPLAKTGSNGLADTGFDGASLGFMGAFALLIGGAAVLAARLETRRKATVK